jgi:ribonucleoside-triphosphate reductase
MEKVERQRCEVYSRVVGFIRPVRQWNNGKTAEFHDRKAFTSEKC